MRKVVKVLVVVILAVIAALGAYVYFAYIKVPDMSGGGGVYVNLTKENFAAVMSQSALVKEMPDEAVISLKIGEDYYAIQNMGLSKTQAKNYDFELSVPDKYLPLMANLCYAVQEAKKNGELGFNSALGNSALMWKYKSMMKYRNCFGF